MRVDTLPRAGRESTIVMSIVRSCFAVLNTRRIRTMRKSRITRMSVGGIGMFDPVFSSTMSKIVITTRKKSKQFQGSLKYCFGPRPMSLSTISKK